MKNQNYRKLIFQAIIDYVLKHGEQTVATLAERFQLSKRQVRVVLLDLGNGFLND